MKKAGDIFFITFVMGLVLVVTLIIGNMLWWGDMTFFFPFILVLYFMIGIFVIRAVVDWEKHRKTFNRIMVVAVALSLLYAVPGIYGKTKHVTNDSVRVVELDNE